MFIKQISIFVENHSGSAADILEILSDNKININALSIADTSDYGIMRLIVDNTDLAKKILQEKGILVKCTDVLAIPMKNAPGGLSEVLKVLKNYNVAIDYMYAFATTENDKATVVAKTDKPDIALDALKKENIF